MTRANFAPSEANQATPAKNLRDEETELDELPPLDGGDDDEAPSTEVDELDEEPADGGDPFDDATGEGDPVDDDMSAQEEGSWLDDETPVELGDGADDLLTASADSESFLAENDELGVGDEDFGLGDEDKVAVVADSGEEGPTDADEELREADLPALDADDEEDGGEESKFFEMAVVGEDDPGDLPFPWELPAWERVGAPVDVGAIACIACAARGVIAARAGALLRVDLEGTATPLEAAGLPTEGILRISLVGASTWVETDGGIYASNDGGATFSREMGWPSEALPGGPLAGGPKPPPRASAVTALAADGTTMAALFSAEENRSWLVCFDAEGEGRTVADVDAASASAQTRMEVKDLAWDETRGVVWVAGDFGVIAFQPPRRRSIA